MLSHFLSSLSVHLRGTDGTDIADYRAKEIKKILNQWNLQTYTQLGSGLMSGWSHSIDINAPVLGRPPKAELFRKPTGLNHNTQNLSASMRTFIYNWPCLLGLMGIVVQQQVRGCNYQWTSLKC